MLPLIVLHGFLGQPSHWDSVLSLARRDAHRVTLPGHGPRPWTLPDAGFDAVVDAMLARPPFSLVPPPWARGTSSAGASPSPSPRVTPDRVAALLLASASRGSPTPPLAPTARALTTDSRASSSPTASPPSFSRWEALPLFASQSAPLDEPSALHRAHRLNHQPDAVAWALSALSPGRMPPRHDALRSLAVPVHLVTGALDRAYTDLARRRARPHRRP
ncbi:MAG: hypothetical protein R3A52_00070 [Polyangiales bacterium]